MLQISNHLHISNISIIILYYITFHIVESANKWITFPGTPIQYIYITQCRGWQDSIDYCQSIGGELASATTTAKRDFLVNTVYDGTSNSGSCTSWDGCYVGGITNKQDTITWFDGTTTGFNETGNLIDWDVSEDEPDNLSSHTVIGFKLQSREWHTVYPGDRNVQFCERIVSSSPTASPTTSTPTPAPTVNPTPSPTINPTVSPTNNPTPAPTSNPIPAPTTYPSRNPTKSPINNPTFAPTDNPTPSPTDNPTPSPTNNPTPVPTNNPTATPTYHPTVSPTDNPTTNVPTSIHTTTSPTVSTKSPTNHPTPTPTNNPTPSLTRTPTIVPTSDSTETSETASMESMEQIIGDDNTKISNSSTTYLIFVFVAMGIIICCCVPLCCIVIGIIHKKGKKTGEVDIFSIGSKTGKSDSKNGEFSPSAPSAYQYQLKNDPSLTIMHTNKMLKIDSNPVQTYNDKEFAIVFNDDIDKDTEIIRNWLYYKVELPQYMNIFIRNDYKNLNMITKIENVNELKNIGIYNKEHQRKIMYKINVLKTAITPISPFNNNNDKETVGNDNITSDEFIIDDDTDADIQHVTDGDIDINTMQNDNNYSNYTEIERWLKFEVGLPEYDEILIRNGYDSMDIIKEITDKSELQDIGIWNIQHQIQIMSAITNLKPPQNNNNNNNRLGYDLNDNMRPKLKNNDTEQLEEIYNDIIIEESHDFGNTDIVKMDFHHINAAENGEINNKMKPHHRIQLTNLADEGHGNNGSINFKSMNVSKQWLNVRTDQ